MTLGMESFDLAVRTILPAVGLLVAISMRLLFHVLAYTDICQSLSPF